jgi:hypothetical protein
MHDVQPVTTTLAELTAAELGVELDAEDETSRDGRRAPTAI